MAERRKPYLVESAGPCMDCALNPARIAQPGPGGSTWLLCIGCSQRRVNADMEALIGELESLGGDHDG